MLILTREDILKVFSMRDAIEADKKAFVLHTEGRAVVPLRINIDNEARDGQIMFMPAYVGGGLNAGGVKIVSCFTGNREKGLPVIPATMAVVDGDTGVVSAILDGTTLTQLRTAAISGAAIELLANPDASVGALFGTGGQAPAQLEALMTARKLSEVRVYDALEGRADAFAAQYAPLAEKFGTKLVPAKTPKEAVTDADVITAVTTSREPVFDAADIKDGCHVTGVGAYTPEMREIPAELLERASRIFVDNREAVLAEAGDFIIAEREGKFSPGMIAGELGELLLGRAEGRRSPKDVTIMKTVGFATLDVVAAAEVVKKAKAAGAGLEVAL